MRMVGFEPRAVEPSASDRGALDGAVRDALSDLVRDWHGNPALQALSELADVVEIQSLWVPEGGISYDPDGTFRAFIFGNLILRWPKRGDLFRSARIKGNIFGRIVKDRATVDDVELAKHPDGSALLLP